MDRTTRCAAKKLREDNLWVLQLSGSLRTLEQAYEWAQTRVKCDVPTRQFTQTGHSSRQQHRMKRAPSGHSAVMWIIEIVVIRMSAHTIQHQSVCARSERSLSAHRVGVGVRQPLLVRFPVPRYRDSRERS